MNTLEPLPARTIVRAAHHECPAEAPGVACVASVISIAYQLQAALRRYFEPRGLSDHKFAALVVLYTFDPIPVTTSDLAFHAQLSRATTSDVLEQLHTASWVARTRATHDRRAVFVRLSKKGRDVTQRALRDALRLFAELGHGIDEATQIAVTNACGALRERIQDVLERHDVPAKPSP